MKRETFVRSHDSAGCRGFLEGDLSLQRLAICIVAVQERNDVGPRPKGHTILEVAEGCTVIVG